MWDWRRAREERGTESDRRRCRTQTRFLLRERGGEGEGVERLSEWRNGLDSHTKKIVIEGSKISVP